MPDNFNDTLDNIKFSLGSAERHFGYGEDPRFPPGPAARSGYDGRAVGEE